MSREPAARPSAVELAPVSPRPRADPPAPPPRSISRRGDERPTLADYLLIVWNDRWLVLAAVAAIVTLALGYLLVTVPTYRTNVLLQVESHRPNLAGLEEISRVLGDAAPPGETEMEILRSRTVVGAVVSELRLDVSAGPVRAPLIGAAVAARYRGAGPAPAVLGLSGYAWGGERIRVDRIDVSDELLDVELRLTALEGSRFRLSDPDGTTLVEGEVGQLASAKTDAGSVELFVTELVARPGTRFAVLRRPRVEVIGRLQRAVRIEEKGRATGILTISMDGPDPRRIAAVLDALANTYVRQNVERKSAETAKTLEFLESQLPIVKANLDEAQSKLNAFQIKRGTVNLTAETQSILDRSVEIERQMTELEMQRSELRQRFTEQHPTIGSLREKIEQLRTERSVIGARMRAVPETEIDAARHQRDVKVASELYSILLNKAQELRVLKFGTVGNVRILDRAAIPRKPVHPMKGAALAFAVVLGLSLGVTGAFARRAMAKGADDADEIERETGLPVYALVPRSDKQGELSRDARRTGPLPLLAAADAGDAAIENLRSLRTSLQFALVEAPNKIVTIGGPSPGVGKTFIAVNLAHVLASTGRRVLVVDADLRRGAVHRYFGSARHPGLSDLVSGAAAPDVAVRSTGFQGLDFLPTGRLPPNPSELLSTHRFQQVLEELARGYEFVIVDTPPILAVTDASVVARLAGVNMLVLRFGQHPIHEIALAVKRLSQTGVRVHGAVLNDVRPDGNPRGKYGRYVRYEYRTMSNE
jgi:tyrosine-protein kinase Etk/Wzc